MVAAACHLDESKCPVFAPPLCSKAGAQAMEVIKGIDSTLHENAVLAMVLGKIRNHLYKARLFVNTIIRRIGL